MSDDLERRLAESLRSERLPDAPDDLRAFLERLPAEAEERPPGRHWRLAWLAPVAAVVVAAALIFALVPHSPPSPSSSPSPSASAATVSGIRWTQVAASTGGGILVEGDGVMSAIAYRNGYLMVGNGGSADHAVWWSSPDGITWQRHDADPVFAGSLLQWILPIPDGLLIVGTSNRLDAECGGGALGCNPVMPLRMWTSVDGATWQRLPNTGLTNFGRAYLLTVVAGPGGLVALGEQLPATGSGMQMMWTSTDGHTWSTAPQFSSAFPSAVVDSVAATTAGFAAVGRPRVTSAPNGPGAAWYSGDGQTWHAVDTEPAMELTRAVGAVDGAIAQGHDAVGNVSLWETTDGTTWAEVTDLPFTLGGRTPAFISDGSRILAVGTDRTTGHGGAWLSNDGTSWQPLPVTGDLPPAEPVGAIGTLGAQGALLVTNLDSPGAGSTAVWFGSFGPVSAPASPSPVPALSVLDPRVLVTPATNLHDGETVTVQLTGFGVGGKVFLSECATAAAASDLGCGAELAAQPFVVTDDTRAGSTSLVVKSRAASGALASPVVACADHCVIVATVGGGYGFAFAPIVFGAAPTGSVPATAAACTTDQLAISVVGTGAGLGHVTGWLRFVNAGSQPCTLRGYPSLVAVTAAGVSTVAKAFEQPWGGAPIDGTPTVTLLPGESALAQYGAGDVPVGSAETCPAPYRTLRVTPPNGTGFVSVSAWNTYLGAYVPSCVGITVTPVVAASAQPDVDLQQP